MNIVLITGKRSMRNLDTVLKKSEQAVTVGKYTSVRPNTATEIYEKYRPHGILVGDDTVTKCVSLIDFLSIIKMRYKARSELVRKQIDNISTHKLGASNRCNER